MKTLKIEGRGVANLELQDQDHFGLSFYVNYPEYGAHIAVVEDVDDLCKIYRFIEDAIRSRVAAEAKSARDRLALAGRALSELSDEEVRGLAGFTGDPAAARVVVEEGLAAGEFTFQDPPTDPSPTKDQLRFTIDRSVEDG